LISTASNKWTNKFINFFSHKANITAFFSFGVLSPDVLACGIVLDIGLGNCFFQGTKLHWPKDSLDLFEYRVNVWLVTLPDVINYIFNTNASTWSKFVAAEELLNQHVVSNCKLLSIFLEETTFSYEIVNDFLCWVAI